MKDVSTGNLIQHNENRTGVKGLPIRQHALPSSHSRGTSRYLSVLPEATRGQLEVHISVRDLEINRNITARMTPSLVQAELGKLRRASISI